MRLIIAVVVVLPWVPRLAVGAGDGHAPLAGHHLSQPRGPLDDGDPPPVRLFHLRVVGGHGGRDDDQLGLAQIGCGVASRSVAGEACRSLPEIVYSRSSSTVAMADSPAPPMPMI
jgi:hypothetical protein